MTNAATAVHRRARQCGGVAGGGAGTAAGIARIGYLGTLSSDDDYKNVTVPFLQGLKETGYVEAARSLKVAPISAPVHSEVENETAIMDLRREPGGGLIVIQDLFTTAHRASIILAAARNNVPAVYTQPTFARDGGLLSYGVDVLDIFRRAATYVDRILRGAKPGDLPVQFPTKLEMVVNLKTAKALGLTVPQSILLRADEVIE
jgi:putative ABC transport system substrate-binding protein